MTTTTELLQRADELLLDLELAHGELTAELSLRLDAWLEDLPALADKLAALRAVAMSATARADLCKAEAGRLRRKQVRHVATTERCKAVATELLLAHERLTGSPKIETALTTYRLQRNSAATLEGPDDPAAWPVWALVEQPPKLDRKALAAAVAETPDRFPGWLLVHGRHLRW